MKRKINTPVILLFCIAIALILVFLKLDVNDSNKKEVDHIDNISYGADIEREHVKYYRDACAQYADNELLIQPSFALSEAEAKSLAEKHGANLVGYISVS